MALVLADRVQQCYVCKIQKPLNDFHQHSTGKYGVNTTCKNCKSLYRKNHYLANKEKQLKQCSKWSSNNLNKKREYRSKRRALILKATPLWASRDSIKQIYTEADFLTKVTNIKYEVDHIIPLQGKNVCGLHVQNNLRIISMTENRKKAYNYEG
jgi:hypothetical protein